MYYFLLYLIKYFYHIILLLSIEEYITLKSFAFKKNNNVVIEISISILPNNFWVKENTGVHIIKIIRITII
jgi:hypothetical protein